MKKNLTKVMATAMAMTMIGSTVAFAEEVVTPAANPDLAMTEDARVEISGDFVMQTGVVEAIEEADENGNVEIFMSDETGGLRFIVAPETRIVDRVDSQYVMVEDLTVGMTVAVVYSAYAPMGMSFPPFMGQVTGVIANADQGNIAVARFNDDLTSDALQLQLNIDEEATMLTRLDGARMAVMPEMLKDGNAIVFYGMTTRSIPAQATPETVFFLPMDEIEIGVDPNFEVGVMPIDTMASPVATPVAEIVAPAYVPVRAVAEGQGFEVVWQGANAPILVKKAGTVIEITIDSADYKVNGTTKTADQKATLISGVLHASDVVFLG